MLVNFLKEKSKPAVAYIIGAIVALSYIVYSIAFDVINENANQFYVALTVVFAGLIALISFGIAKKNKVMTLGFIVALLGYFNFAQLQDSFSYFSAANTYFKFDYDASGVFEIMIGIFAILMFIVGLLFVLGKFAFKNRAVKEVFGYVIIFASAAAAVLMIIAFIIQCTQVKDWGKEWNIIFYYIAMILYPVFVFVASTLTESFSDKAAE